MGNSSPFIFTIVLSIILILFAAHRHQQLSSSINQLSHSLNKLNSKVSLFDSFSKKFYKDLRDNKEEIEAIRVYIAEKFEEIDDTKQNKIDLSKVLSFGSEVLINYRSTVIEKAILALTWAHNWMDGSADEDGKKSSFKKL